MALAPVSSAAPSSNSAFGLDFQSLLRIVLTQLTYQDPLKPMDNFEFVSQLAQFSQIQQGQTTNDRLQSIAAAQGSLQAAGLPGRTAAITANSGAISGKVTAVTFNNGNPQITVQTKDNQTISQISIASISQIREAQ